MIILNILYINYRLFFSSHLVKLPDDKNAVKFIFVSNRYSIMNKLLKMFYNKIKI